MKCKHFNFILKESDRYYIPALEYDNCALCLINDCGPLTQEEVANYFGLSKMRICQIEKKAIQKLERRLAKLQE